MKDHLNSIMELELFFSANSYNGNGKKAFEIEKGNIPVMISAPHAVNQFRNGKIKYADTYTGAIAKYLHMVTGCHAIYSSKYTETDPNYDLPQNNNYQRKLKKYILDNEIYLLIDIHGASKERKFIIEMGTASIKEKNNVFSDECDPSLQEYQFIDDIIKEKFENELEGKVLKQNIVWKNVLFCAGKQNTITKYISKNTNAACIQIEINNNYRNPEQRENFNILIKCFIELIDIFSKIDWKYSKQKIIYKK